MSCATLHELMIVGFPRADGRARFDPELSGGPSWINADHFDVIAKLPEGQGFGIDAGNSAVATAAEASAINRVKVMLQTLLTDRFKLSTHNEQRDLPLYELRIDRNDGTLGPQLKRVDVDCVAQRGTGTLCGGFRSVGPGHLEGHGVTLSLLAQFLETAVSRNVIDRTGQQGTFDVDLQYTPDRLQLCAPETPTNEPTGLSIFTAVREQLGLRLDSTTGPVDVLVIDHVEKPAAD